MTTPKLRCAVYTRKSSEEGLEQSFNSLHAQREACEAYIKSQVGEGWTLNAAEYDDGGFSGGNTDRPALKRLLADIARGQIDVVVVYKVDRLTRSLTDFARIVDVFDRSKVSFVSITQSFNTTSSMGRLTLNVLLSFAQFEREVTGERIRDKIAQSKAKGLWMGGVLPLGYDSKDHVLVINEAEAQTVRAIFRRYLKLGSVDALQRELQAKAVRSKSWVTSKGRAMGGMTFSRGALYHLLQNHHYRGLIKHKGKTYPGQHSPIVDSRLFEAVQAVLMANRIQRTNQVARVAKSPLVGRIFDGEGRPFTPTFSKGGRGKTYRYYVAETGSGERPRRLPAEQLEDMVLHLVRRIAGRPDVALEALPVCLEVVQVRPASILLAFPVETLFGTEHPDLALEELKSNLHADERATLDGDGTLVKVSIPTKLRFRGGRTWISGMEATPVVSRNRFNPALVSALKSAHAVLAFNGIHPTNPFAGVAAAKAPPNTHQIRLSKLAFLAPDLQQDILEGRQPPDLGVADLLEGDIPLGWSDQRLWLEQITQAPGSKSAAKR